MTTYGSLFIFGPKLNNTFDNIWIEIIKLLDPYTIPQMFSYIGAIFVYYDE